MKIKYAVLVFVSVLMLAACTGNPSTDEIQTSGQKEEETGQEINLASAGQQREPKNSQEKTEPYIPEQSDEKKQQEMMDYKHTVYTGLDMLKNGISDYMDGNMEASKDLRLLEDSAWQSKQASALRKLEEAIGHFQDSNVPDNPLAISAHRSILTGLDYYKKSIDLYKKGMLAADVDLLMKSEDILKEGTDHILISADFMRAYEESVN